MLDFLDKLVGYIRGFGFGRATIKKEVYSCLKLLKISPEIVIDCGGNKGIYTEEILRVNPNSQVIIFEPSQVNIGVLENKFAGNSKVRLIEKAVSSQPGELVLYSDAAGSGNASLANRRLEHFDMDFSVREIVTVTTIDSEIESLEIDILKMDIEGFEFEALRGATTVLKNVKVVQFEFGGANIDSRTYFQDFFYFFKDQSFTIWRITPLGLVKVTKYNERMERFTTTNYLASNNKYIR